MAIEVSANKILDHILYLADIFGLPHLWAAAAVYGDTVQRTFLSARMPSAFITAQYGKPEPFSKIDCAGAEINRSFMYRAGFGTEPMMRAVWGTQKLVDAHAKTLPGNQAEELRHNRLRLLPVWQTIDSDKLKLLCFKIRADRTDRMRRLARANGDEMKGAKQIESLTFSALNQLVQRDLKVKEIVLIPSVAGYTATSVPVTYFNVDFVRNRISQKPSVSAHL